MALTSKQILVLLLAPALGGAADLRLGLIGTDTSHAIEFTRMLNDSAAADHVPGAHVVAAYKGGSPDLSDSSSRVDKYAAELKSKWNITFVNEIRDLCALVDGILLESLDGRPHLRQFREAVTCGKPVFVDKPLASTLSDAREIAHVAAGAKTPWFSSSSMRYIEALPARSPQTLGVFVWGPGPLEEHHQLDLSWYAIHPIEMLFALMGPDVIDVSRTYTDGADVITGRWKDGRIGTVRAGRPYSSYGAVLFLPENRSEVKSGLEVGYEPLVRQIVKFMQTGTPPVPNSETLKIFAFLDAAQRSREAGGKTIPVE